MSQYTFDFGDPVEMQTGASQPVSRHSSNKSSPFMQLSLRGVSYVLLLDQAKKSPTLCRLLEDPEALMLGGAFYIDRSPTLFLQVIDFICGDSYTKKLRTQLSKESLAALEEELDYFEVLYPGKSSAASAAMPYTYPPSEEDDMCLDLFGGDEW